MTPTLREYSAYTRIVGELEVNVYPLLYGARVCIGPNGAPWVDDSW